MARQLNDGRPWSDDERERRRRDDQRQNREREWRNWEREELAWRGGSRYRGEPMPRNDREREWQDYDRDRQREYEARRAWHYSDPMADSYWSPYESGDESYTSGADGTSVTHVASGWGRGPKGYQRSDDRINEEVCERLTFSPVDASDIEVQVLNGEVTLAGTVRSRWEKRQAEDLAEVFGVREVHNQLRVTPVSAA